MKIQNTIFLILLSVVLVACGNDSTKDKAEDYAEAVKSNQQKIEERIAREEAMAEGRLDPSEITREDVERYNQRQKQLIAENEKKLLESFKRDDERQEKAEKAKEEAARARRNREGSSNSIITELNENAVQTFLDRFEDAAFNDRDIDKISEFISHDVDIRIKVPGAAEAMVMSKNQYLGSLEHSYNMVENYRYNKLSSRISIDGNTATVRGKQRESFEMLGQSITMGTDDVMEIELNNGRLLITKIEADVYDM